MKKQNLPQGWTEEKIQSVIKHFELQTETEAVAEDESAWSEPGDSWVQVPIECLDAVQKILAKKSVNNVKTADTVNEKKTPYGRKPK